MATVRKYERKYDYAAVVNLFDLGDSITTISQKLSIPNQMVRYALHKNGRQWNRPRVGEKSPRRRAARILKQAGLTYEEIGVAFGITRQRAQQLVNLTPTDTKALRVELGNACGKCGATGGKLDLHHDQYSGGPDRLLCVPCHKTADAEFRHKRILQTVAEELARR